MFFLGTFFLRSLCLRCRDCVNSLLTVLDSQDLSSFAVVKDYPWFLTCLGIEVFVSILFKGSGFFAVFGRLSEFW